MSRSEHFRRTSQKLMPVRRAPTPPGQYDIYPAFPLAPGAIKLGFDALAEEMVGQKQVVIDGYTGILWDEFRAQLTEVLEARGISTSWQPVSDALKPIDELEQLAAPFLGGDDPIFGTRFTGRLQDFFAPAALQALKPDETAGLSIIYGCGAALAGREGLLVYLDLPKNELQFRARAGVKTNLFQPRALSPKEAYKRSYFVDWPVLNQHKTQLLSRIDVFVDGQRPDEPTFARGPDLRAGLTRMSRSWFRVRPWFEPGPWGGQWIKDNIPQLPKDVPNYAWSFELIVPENGLAFESEGLLLEASFDCLMFQETEAVLGEAAPRFGAEFPIRFDFLDTVDGGNLSLQCHPRPAYIREHFGETFTQDETYYILDCTPDAEVYLGFREGIQPEAFRQALEQSFEEAVPVEVKRFVQLHPAQKHDLFLIPSGTVHCSGVGNLVLEISATPYIFTFKMYDWLRLDLEGRPRPLNIERAFENLCFDRQGERVKHELISQPQVLEHGPDWRLIHLPTHSEHFYDVHRLEFATSVEVTTEDSCHILSLVEGRSVLLEVEGMTAQRFNYAETFVVPAATGRYRLIYEGLEGAKVVKAFVKPGRGP